MARIDTHWFQSQLADRRLSQRKLAHLMGLDPGAVSLMLNGKRRLSAAEAGEIARLLNVDVTEVLTRAGVTGQMGQKAAPAGAPEFETEFMQRWIALGMLIMKNRGP